MLAPADFMPSHDQDITDPGRPTEPPPPPVPPDEGTPTPSADPRETKPLEAHAVNIAARTGFGVTFPDAVEPRIEPSLIQEIEAISSEEIEGEGEGTRPYDTPTLWSKAVILGGIFVIATSLGFLTVWLLLR